MQPGCQCRVLKENKQCGLLCAIRQIAPCLNNRAGGGGRQKKQPLRNVHFGRGVGVHNTMALRGPNTTTQLGSSSASRKNTAALKGGEISRGFAELNGKQTQKPNRPNRICSTPHTWQQTGTTATKASNT